MLAMLQEYVECEEEDARSKARKRAREEEENGQVSEKSLATSLADRAH